MATAAERAKAEKAKSYKVEHDVQRVHHLIMSAFYMRDFPAVSALQAALVKELSAINLKQLDLDEQEREAEKRAAPVPAPELEEEPHSSPRSGGRHR